MWHYINVDAMPLPENPLASMVNLPIIGNLPIGAKGFPIVAKRFYGRG